MAKTALIATMSMLSALVFMPTAAFGWQGQTLENIAWSDNSLDRLSTFRERLDTPFEALPTPEQEFETLYQINNVAWLINADHELHLSIDGGIFPLNIKIQSFSAKYQNLWIVTDAGELLQWIDSPNGGYFQLSPFQPAQLGSFLMVTYNTAGLPSFVKGFSANRNLEIGKRLNDYDIALVQEDFVYHNLLTRYLELPFQSQITPEHSIWKLLKKGKLTLDGLHRFSIFEFTDFKRHLYSTCYGIFDHANDCLASKGYTTASVHLSDTVRLSVINTHLEAGGSDYDNESRLQQLTELKTEIYEQMNLQAAGIIAGDWNLRWDDERDAPQLAYFHSDLNIQDASKTVATEYQYKHKIDRVMYWHSSSMTLTPLDYRDEEATYKDAAGNPLSDHSPVSVSFLFAESLPQELLSNTVHGQKFTSVEVIGDRLIRVAGKDGKIYLGTYQ